MATYGYARASAEDQDTSIQVQVLTPLCDVVRSENRTGTTMAGRVELDTLLQFLRQGDTLLVTRIDRLARSLCDLMDIVRTLDRKGVLLKAVEQPIDTSTAAGRAFLQMLGVFAEFETNIRKERQMEGIAKAKAEGVYKGRPASIQVSTIQDLQAQGRTPSQIAKDMGIARSSVYRLLAEAQGQEAEA